MSLMGRPEHRLTDPLMLTPSHRAQGRVSGKIPSLVKMLK